MPISDGYVKPVPPGPKIPETYNGTGVGSTVGLTVESTVGEYDGTDVGDTVGLTVGSTLGI